MGKERREQGHLERKKRVVKNRKIPLYSMKIKEQTRKLAAGSSKHRFEVVDRTDEVSSKHRFEVADRTDEVSSKHYFEVVDRTDEVSSKHCFEVVDRTDEVSNIYTTRRH